MKKLAYLIVIIAGILTLLVVGKTILIPFVYGILLWFLGRYFKSLAYRIPFFEKHLPSWLVNSVIFVFIVFILAIISGIITANVNTLMQSYPSYQANLDTVVEKINNLLEIDLYQDLTERLKTFDFSTVLQPIADELTGIFGNLIMVLLYAMFIFSEEAAFSQKLKKLFVGEENYARASNVLNKISTSVSDYIRLKTLVSLLTGGVGYIFLVIMGVDAPFFWALLMFLLNYIPTIGSLVATLFPAVFSLLQFGTFTPFLIILIGLGLIEWFIGNVIEPRVMGSSLNISPLVTIIALVVWGQIWGITGMLLSVPITVIMVIILSQFDATKDAAILLSENGDID